VAIEANLASKRSMGVKQIAQLKVRLTVLGTRRRQIMDKSLSGVFSDSDTKMLLSEAEQESDDLQSQIAAAEGPGIVPEEVIKTGLAVLQDMAMFWHKASLTTKQQFQGFLFPEGIAFGWSGFGTCTTAFCMQRKAVVSMSENAMVGHSRRESNHPENCTLPRRMIVGCPHCHPRYTANRNLDYCCEANH
jgi:site-specific DNA recombinase